MGSPQKEYPIRADPKPKITFAEHDYGDGDGDGDDDGDGRRRGRESGTRQGLWDREQSPYLALDCK